MEFQRKSSVASSIDKFLQDIPKRLSNLSIRSQQSTETDTHQLPEFLQDEETEKHAFLYIRDQVLEEVQKILGEVHPKDIEYFKTSNDMIARFLYEYADAHVKQSMEEICDQVCQNILETLKWRKSVGLHDLKITDFPYEVIEMLNYMHSIYIGHDGRLYLYLAAANAPNLGEWSAWTEKMIYFMLDDFAHRYARNKEKGLIQMKPIIIGDISGARVGQAKSYLPFALSIKTALLNHFPGYCHEVWTFGLPWYLKSFFWLGLKLVPSYLQKKAKIMDLDSAVEAVGIENLPKEIGGRHEGAIFFESFQGAVSIEEFAEKQGISNKEVIRMKKHIEEVKKRKGKHTL